MHNDSCLILQKKSQAGRGSTRSALMALLLAFSSESCQRQITHPLHSPRQRPPPPGSVHDHYSVTCSEERAGFYGVPDKLGISLRGSHAVGYSRTRHFTGNQHHSTPPSSVSSLPRYPTTVGHHLQLSPSSQHPQCRRHPEHNTTTT